VSGGAQSDQLDLQAGNRVKNSMNNPEDVY
jgi:hypothetical protein